MFLVTHKVSKINTLNCYIRVISVITCDISFTIFKHSICSIAGYYGIRGIFFTYLLVGKVCIKYLSRVMTAY